MQTLENYKRTDAILLGDNPPPSILQTSINAGLKSELPALQSFEDEKIIQGYGKSLMERFGHDRGLPNKILLEDFSNIHDDVLQETPWIIKQDLKVGKDGVAYNIVGLQSSIASINKNIFQKIIEKNPQLSLPQVIEGCTNHFIDLFNQSNNKCDTFKIIFENNQGSFGCLQRCVLINGVEVSYLVYAHEKPSKMEFKNNFYHIREKRLHDVNGTGVPDTTHERADFMTYVNGIPLILHEYKTIKTGLHKAVTDMQNKKTYSKVPFVLVTDGVNAALLSSPYQINQKDNNMHLYLWSNYTDAKMPVHIQQDEAVQTSLQNICHTLLCDYENLAMYMQYCVFVDKTNSSYGAKEIIKLARVQQFTAFNSFRKELNVLLKAPSNKRAAQNFGVLHTQRSGKTMTMRMMVHLLLNSYGNVYSSIYSNIVLHAPDLTILGVLIDEFSNMGLDMDKVLIDSRKRYQEVVEHFKANPTSQNLYIVNMQKISQETGLQKYDGANILNIIDEGHVAQTGFMANTRGLLFPNASNVVFTATPKPDTYSAYFNKDKGKILDVFSYVKAVEADIIVPVIFHRAPKSSATVEAMSFAERVEEEVFSRLVDMVTMHSDTGRPQEDIDKEAREILNSTSQADQLRRTLNLVLQDDLSQEKLDYIALFQDKVSNSLMIDDALAFHPKALLFVSSQQEAQNLITFIQDQHLLNGSSDLHKQLQVLKKTVPVLGQEGAHLDRYDEVRRQLLSQLNSKGELNSYKNWRFALDHSSLDDDLSQMFNGGHVLVENISSLFKSQRKEDGCIDVLIAVDKYTKGYDLPELTTVFLGKNIAEPSLMNQIFTRPATKRSQKGVGYCVDLMFGNTNFKTYEQSMKLYNSEEDMETLVLSDEKAQQIVDQVTQDIHDVCQLAGIVSLDDFNNDTLLKGLGGFVKDATSFSDIISKHLEFATIGRRIFNRINNLRSVVYLQEHKRALSVIYDTFVALKHDYANRVSKNYTSVNEGFGVTQVNEVVIAPLLLQRQAIIDSINTVLGCMNKNNGLAALLNLSYSDVSDLPQAQQEKEKELMDAAQDMRKKEQKYRLVTEVSNQAQKMHLTALHERIQSFIEKITNNPSLLYTQDSEQEMLALIQESDQARKQKILQIKNENKSVLQYFIQEKIEQEFARIHPLTDKEPQMFIALFAKDMAEPIDEVRNMMSEQDASQQLIAFYNSIENKLGLSDYVYKMHDVYAGQEDFVASNLYIYAPIITNQEGKFSNFLDNVIHQSICDSEALRVELQ